MATPGKIIVFAKNGKPLSAHHRTKLSSLAWFAGKLPTKYVQELLAEIGVTDPLASTWTLDLPNGVTVSAIEIDDDGKTTSLPRPPKAEQTTKRADRKGKAAERIAKLDAHKRAAKAARDSGAPIADGSLAAMTVEQAAKVEQARRTRTAPAAVAG